MMVAELFLSTVSRSEAGKGVSLQGAGLCRMDPQALDDFCGVLRAIKCVGLMV